ncbi:hypothetical protein PSP6_210202 [Paraburkholderia tropica]|nr:hypothetical protein PSP6_210202 [Paraburkholderia tropica]
MPKHLAFVPTGKIFRPFLIPAILLCATHQSRTTTPTQASLRHQALMPNLPKPTGSSETEADARTAAYAWHQ